MARGVRIVWKNLRNPNTWTSLGLIIIAILIWIMKNSIILSKITPFMNLIFVIGLLSLITGSVIFLIDRLFEWEGKRR